MTCLEALAAWMLSAILPTSRPELPVCRIVDVSDPRLAGGGRFPEHSRIRTRRPGKRGFGVRRRTGSKTVSESSM